LLAAVGEFGTCNVVLVLKVGSFRVLKYCVLWIQEMSEVRTILAEATDRSLVLVDEVCRGTDVEKGSFIAASVVEALDYICCIGILSTHLHNLLDMELQTNGKKGFLSRLCRGQKNFAWHEGGQFGPWPVV